MRTVLFYCMFPVLVLWILRKPYIGLVLYTVVNIIRPEMLFWGGSQAAFVFIVFMGASLVSLFLNLKGSLFLPLRIREFWLLVCMWIAVLVSLANSPYPLHPQAMYYATEILKLTLLAWLVFGTLHDNVLIEQYEKIFLLCFTVLGLWGIEQHFRGNERLENFPLGDSNGVAALLVFVLPLALNYSMHSTKSRERLCGTLATIILVLSLVSTQSRGGFLGGCVAIAVFFFWARRKKALLVLVTVVITVAVLFAPESFFQRLSTLSPEENERDASAQSRIILWKTGMMIFNDHPLTGAGFFAFPKAKMEYQYKVTDDDDIRQYTFNDEKVAHNSYIQVLSEGGLLLAIPYFLFIGGTFIGNWKIRKKWQDREANSLVDLLNAIECGIVGFCVCIVFINTLTTIFLPLQILVSRRIRDQLNSPPVQISTSDEKEEFC